MKGKKNMKKNRYYLILILLLLTITKQVNAVTSQGKVYQTTTKIKIEDIINNKVTSINVKRNVYNTTN